MAAAARGVAISVSDIYDITVAPGTWVPLAISVTDTRPADFDGQLVVSVPVSQVSAGQGCFSVGTSIVCTGGVLSTSNYSSTAPLPVVTYRISLSLAPGTTKEVVAYALAESTEGTVVVNVRARTGQLLATASAQVPVAFGNPQPAVLVVTDDPSGVSALGDLTTPTGSHPQLQYIAPADLPGSAAALGAFSAVVVDQADTSILSPAQADALEGYADAGGTVVVATGVQWRATTAGLPSALLPARVSGTGRPVALSSLARLLDTPGPNQGLTWPSWT